MMDDGKRGNAPKMSRAIQDHIGQELREMYAELLRQALPENLVAPLRSTGDGTGSVRRLEQPVSNASNSASAPPNALQDTKIA